MIFSSGDSVSLAFVAVLFNDVVTIESKSSNHNAVNVDAY